MSWQYVKIGDVCKTGAGGTPLKSKKEFYEGGTIPWLLSGEVSQGEIFASKQFITDEGLQNSSAKLFPKNTVLVAMYGATAGQVGVLRFEASTNQAVCGIYPNDKFLPEFIYYSMLYKQKELISKATGNAQPNISQIKVKNTDIPLIGKEEQKRIVAILDEAFAGIDTAIANTEKNLANTRELFESYLNSVFKDQRDDWSESCLSSFIDITHGYAFKSKDFEVSTDVTLPIVLTPGNYTENCELKFTEKNTKRLTGELSEEYLFNKGDLTVVMTDLSSKMKILGKPAFINSSNILHNQRIGRVIFKVSTIEPRYLYFYLQTRYVSDEIKSTSTGTMVKHTAPKRILSLKISYPEDKKTQRDIVNSLDYLSQEIVLLETIYQQKLKSLKMLKQSLLQKAFSSEPTVDKRKLMEDEFV